MADINLQMTQRNAENTDWDNLNPLTKAANVKMADGTTVEVKVNEHLADFTKQIPYATTTGSANTYTVSTNPALPNLVAGVAITVKIHVVNTGASTLNWDGKGAKAIKKANGNDVSSGNLKLNGVYTLRYDGTSFILQGEGGEYGTATPNKVSVGYTVATEAGGIQEGTFTADATAVATEIALGKTAYVNGAEVTGTNTKEFSRGDSYSALYSGEDVLTEIASIDYAIGTTNAQNSLGLKYLRGFLYTYYRDVAGGQSYIRKYNLSLALVWQSAALTTALFDQGDMYVGTDGHVYGFFTDNASTASQYAFKLNGTNGAILWKVLNQASTSYSYGRFAGINSANYLVMLNIAGTAITEYDTNGAKTAKTFANVASGWESIYCDNDIYYGADNDYVRRWPATGGINTHSITAGTNLDSRLSFFGNYLIFCYDSSTRIVNKTDLATVGTATGLRSSPMFFPNDRAVSIYGGYRMYKGVESAANLNRLLFDIPLTLTGCLFAVDDAGYLYLANGTTLKKYAPLKNIA